jgi:hypothetical protein
VKARSKLRSNIKIEMNRIALLLLLAPFLLATQCEDDENSGFETNYLMENDTGTDLYLMREDNRFLQIKDQSSESIGSELNSITEPVPPEEAQVIEGIQLFERVNTDFILRYRQDPLENELWTLTEPSVNRFEYKLVITETDLE